MAIIVLKKSAINTNLKSAALTVRDNVRNMVANPAMQRRQNKARDIYKKAICPDSYGVVLISGAAAASLAVKASDRKSTHTATLFDDGRSSCDCPDATRRGTICKHQMALAASLIHQAAQEKKAAEASR